MFNGYSSYFRGIGKETFRQASISIRSQKLRSFLTLLGIVIGVAPVIALVGIMDGFSEQITGAFARFGVGVVEFQKYDSANGPGDDEVQRKRRDLRLQDAEALSRQVKAAKGVSPEAQHVLFGDEGVVKNDRGDEADNPVIQGVWPSFQQVREVALHDGRFFTDAELNHRNRYCIIGSDVADALFPNQVPLGRRVLAGSASLLIIGTLTKRGNSLDGEADNVILIPLSTWADIFPQRLTDNSGALTIALAPRNPLYQEAMLEEAVAVLRLRRRLKANQENDFHYSSTESEMKSLKEIASAISGGVILVAAMALLVGGIGVMNIMLVSVTERTREIGIRKALGATKWNILAQFLIEAVALTSVGGLVGVCLGMGGSLLIRLVTPLPASAPLWSAGLGFGVSATVGLFFGLWPAIKAADQDPIVALRYE